MTSEPQDVRHGIVKRTILSGLDRILIIRIILTGTGLYGSVPKTPICTMNDSKVRMLENIQEVQYVPIIIVGAGESGIAMGCRLKSELGLTDFHIFDRQGGIGGTWYINQYPGWLDRLSVKTKLLLHPLIFLRGCL